MLTFSLRSFCFAFSVVLLYSHNFLGAALNGPKRSSPTPEPIYSDLAEEQKDVLDREKCLEALASLRHAKWFQVRRLHFI